MNNQVMQQYEYILNAYLIFLVKESSLKRLYPVWSHLYDILEKAKI